MNARSGAAVDHVTVTTPESLENAVLSFYSQVLGLERLPKPQGTGPRGAWYQAGGAELHVSVEPDSPARPGHFGVVVSDYESQLTQLRAARAPIEPARSIPGRDRCYTRDPAGNTIEILCYRGPDAQA